MLSIDDTLLPHSGQEFEQIAKLYDPVKKHYVWAHNLVTLHYSDDECDYPLLFQLWKPVELEKLEAGMRAAGIPFKPDKEAWKTSDPKKWRRYLLRAWKQRQKAFPQIAELYDSKLSLAQKLLQEWVGLHPGQEFVVTFDDWYTEADFCQFIERSLGLAYVGTLNGKKQIHLQTGKESLQAFAERLKREHQSGQTVFHKISIPYKGGRESYYTYCHNHQLAHFGKQRLVINHRKPDLSDEPAFFISNRLYWGAEGITRIRRHRWPVEVYHEEGKAEGLDKYQLRDFGAIERHIALVAVVYSMLRAAQHDPSLHDKLQRQLELNLEGSLPDWRRLTQAQVLWCLGLFISAALARGQPLLEVMAPLMRAMCRKG